MSLLEIKGLTTEFKTDGGTVRAVRGVDYHVEAAKFLESLESLVRESRRECFRSWASWQETER